MDKIYSGAKIYKHCKLFLECAKLNGISSEELLMCCTHLAMWAIRTDECETVEDLSKMRDSLVEFIQSIRFS